ncbi:MAG: hypothetical protein KGI73_02105 [Patescibacteria group bacterium]|nr:hypothetical protein [Patescibacteria group bacterium]
MNTFSHLSSFLRSFLKPYPARDWFIALVAVFFIFLGFAFYGVYVYFGIETGALFAVTGGTKPAITITTADIQNVVDAYNVRVVNWNAGNIPVPDVTDPSVPAK